MAKIQHPQTVRMANPSPLDAPPRSPGALCRCDDGRASFRRRSANEEAVEVLLLRKTSSVIEALMEHLLVEESMDPVNDAMLFLKKQSASSAQRVGSASGAAPLSPPPRSSSSPTSSRGERFDPRVMASTLSPILEQLHQRILSDQLPFLRANDGPSLIAPLLELSLVNGTLMEDDEEEDEDEESLENGGTAPRRQPQRQSQSSADLRNEESIEEIIAREFAHIVEDRKAFQNRSFGITS